MRRPSVLPLFPWSPCQRGITVLLGLRSLSLQEASVTCSNQSVEATGAYEQSVESSAQEGGGGYVVLVSGPPLHPTQDRRWRLCGPGLRSTPHKSGGGGYVVLASGSEVDQLAGLGTATGFASDRENAGRQLCFSES